MKLAGPFAGFALAAAAGLAAGSAPAGTAESFTDLALTRCAERLEAGEAPDISGLSSYEDGDHVWLSADGTVGLASDLSEEFPSCIVLFVEPSQRAEAVTAIRAAFDDWFDTRIAGGRYLSLDDCFPLQSESEQGIVSTEPGPSGSLLLFILRTLESEGGARAFLKQTDLALADICPGRG